jgi:hypothetical protein
MSAVLEPPLAFDAAKLRWGKYSPAYRKRLLQSGRTLHLYLQHANLSWGLVERAKAKVVDDLLVQFTHELHAMQSKSGLRIAKHAVLLVQVLRPRLRKGLQGAWEAIKSWEEQTPSHFRPPLPLPLLTAIICKARVIAERATEERDRSLWRTFSVLVMTGFFGLLRPGEIFNLRAQDVVLPNSLSLAGEFAVLRIVRPKNSRQMGSQQYVEIRHPDVINWLAWLKNQRPDSAPSLWPSTAYKFRVMFKFVCTKLHIDSLRFSPASLRAGGATFLVDENVEVGKVRFLGRWSHLRTLERYVQVARAQQIALTIQPEVACKLKEFLCKFFFLLGLPKFLAAQVHEANLVPSLSFETFETSHAVSASRSWGRMAQTISEGRSCSWTVERSKIH